MEHRSRGRAVVISNRFFIKADLEARDGAEFDEVNVDNLFTKLQFDVTVHRNRTAKVCITLLH